MSWLLCVSRVQCRVHKKPNVRACCEPNHHSPLTSRSILLLVPSEINFSKLVLPSDILTSIAQANMFLTSSKRALWSCDLNRLVLMVLILQFVTISVANCESACCLLFPAVSYIFLRSQNVLFRITFLNISICII
jgi:hypothetical protein